MNKVEQNKLGHYDWMIIYLFLGLVLISYPGDICCNGIWAFITTWSSFLTSAEIRQRGLVGSMGPWKMRRVWGLHSKMRCWDVPFEQHPDGTVIVRESEICREEKKQQLFVTSCCTAVHVIKFWISETCIWVDDPKMWASNKNVTHVQTSLSNPCANALSRVCVLHSSLFLLGEQKKRHWYAHEKSLLAVFIPNVFVQ
jgi:hypothetical protein